MLLSIVWGLVIAAFIVILFLCRPAPYRRRNGVPLPPPEPPEAPKPEIGETIEIGSTDGWYMRDLHTGGACRVGKGGTVRLVAEKNGFVLVEYVRASQESASNCPVGTRGILSIHEYLAARAVEMKIFEKDRAYREAVKFFRNGE